MKASGEVLLDRRAMNAQLRRNLDHFGDWDNEEQEHFRLSAKRNDLIQRVLLELRPKARILAYISCFTGVATAQFKALGFRHRVGYHGFRGCAGKSCAAQHRDPSLDDWRRAVPGG
jgi:hypothetical protein